MVMCYCKAGDLTSLREVFEASLQAMASNVMSWNTMIDGYCKAGHYEILVLLLPVARHCHVEHDDAQKPEQQMLVMPTTVTMATMVTTCTQIGDFALGQQVHHYIWQFGTKINTMLSNALIGMYFKCRNMNQALDIFTAMLDAPNLFCWKMVIAGLRI
ncbi:hypothetical protein E2562_026110 [Oryza meyeriana var. granulata]|uniref:Pentatricopeptide repeat-containing protein n=1 Tax=Oryza meyeriana var. granulata TaxID=110450 RepID=A0A6G1BYU4_9ORYZ|nr:hypothetical protein E2562_026110 [Oryza meyeriana var. granulata]